MRELQEADMHLRECMKAVHGQEFNRDDMGIFWGYLQHMGLHDGALVITAPKRRGIVNCMPHRWTVPESMRSRYLKEAHDSILGGHIGVFKTAERIKQLSHWWPSMDLDTENHVKQCKVCQRASNKGQQPRLSLQSLPATTRPNARVHFDMMGPLKGRNGTKKWVLVGTDAFTNIVCLTVLEDKSASSVSKAIMRDWVYIYGVPSLIFSDQGGEFCADLQKKLWQNDDAVPPAGQQTGRGVQQGDGGVPEEGARAGRG
jgi:hypothetical protein